MSVSVALSLIPQDTHYMARIGLSVCLPTCFLSVCNANVGTCRASLFVAFILQGHTIWCTMWLRSVCVFVCLSVCHVELEVDPVGNYWLLSHSTGHAHMHHVTQVCLSVCLSHSVSVCLSHSVSVCLSHSVSVSVTGVDVGTCGESLIVVSFHRTCTCTMWLNTFLPAARGSRDSVGLVWFQ